MPSVSIHPPKTPVTKGSFGIAKATLPNMCKMPGPPAPFVPTPLPNIGKSGDSPQGYSTSVKIEGSEVAIRGATFNSMGDIASKALGGGMLSMNTHGPTKFIGPGSLTVQIEGKGVHLVGEPMFNNCGPTGSPPNSATLSGERQGSSRASAQKDKCAKLKARFKLVVGSHSSNASKKSRTNQSHHINQDEAMKHKFVPTGEGFAILLRDSRRGTEHRIITNRQNARRDNKRFGRPGPKPAVTFGDLKKQAEADLAAGLEGKRKDAEGRPMTKKQAEDAAKCLVAEAEKAAKKSAKKRNKKLNNNSRVDRPGGCFAPATLLRLLGGELCPVEQLAPGAWIKTASGSARVTRVDVCHHDLVELRFAGGSVRLASHHRLLDAAGEARRADGLRIGERLATARGTLLLEGTRRIEGLHRIYSIGLSRDDVCLLGADDLLAVLPDSGPPVVRREALESFQPGGF